MEKTLFYYSTLSSPILRKHKTLGYGFLDETFLNNMIEDREIPLIFISSFIKCCEKFEWVIKPFDFSSVQRSYEKTNSIV